MQGFVTRVRQVANKCHGVIYLWITKYICESWNTFVNRVSFVWIAFRLFVTCVSFVWIAFRLFVNYETNLTPYRTHEDLGITKSWESSWKLRSPIGPYISPEYEYLQRPMMGLTWPFSRSQTIIILNRSVTMCFYATLYLLFNHSKMLYCIICYGTKLDKTLLLRWSRE